MGWLHAKSLTGHLDTVSSLAITADERLVASASFDGSIRVWDRKSARCLQRYDSDKDCYQQVFFLKAGHVIAYASSSQCGIWRVGSGGRPELFAAERLSAAAGANLLAIGTELGEVTIIDSQDVRILGTVSVLKGSIHTLGFSPDEGAVLAAGEGFIARIDLAQMKPVWIAKGHDPRILMTKVLISIELGFAVSCSYDGTARVWDLDGGRSLAVLRHSAGVESAAISPDGKFLITHSGDDLLWDTQSWTRLRRLPGGNGQIINSRFSQDGDRIFGVGADGCIRIWETQSGLLAESPNRRGKRLLALLVCDGGKEIITCGNDPDCQIWRASQLDSVD